MLLLLPLFLPLFSTPAHGEQQLSNLQKELIALTQLPKFDVNYSFSYQPSDFDEQRWGDRAGKIAALRTRLESKGAGPAQLAETNYEIASLLVFDRREEEARPYRDAAARLFQQALTQAPRTASLLYKAGLSRTLLGNDADRKGAAALYAEAVKADPTFCQPYLEMMEPWATVGLLDEAEGCFKRAVERKGASAEDHYRRHIFIQNRHILDLLNGRKFSTVKEAAASAQPVNTLMDAITSDAALIPLQKAVELEPKSVKYQGSLGAVQSLRLFMEQMKRFAPLLAAEKPMNDAFLISAKGTAEAKKELLREAKERFLFVEQQAPNTYPALYALWSVQLVLEGKQEEAEQKLLNAIRLDPHQDSYVQSLMILYKAGWPDGSAPQKERDTRFREMLEKKCSVSCSTLERAMIARIRFEEGQYKEVEKQFRAARDKDGASLPVRTGLVVALLRQHKFEEAIDEMAAARQYLSGATAEYQAHFASLSSVLLLLMGDQQGAVEWLNKAYSLNPNDPVTLKLGVKNGK
jgi:tetratricopeptide (TPR) repeat protein